MRNIFDQYSQPENRLTHALISSLAADRKLLRRFIRWATGCVPPKTKLLEVVEQRLPGDPEVAEEESERRGLPDAWIHDDESWALLIESKVSSSLRNEQLRRHYRTALRRGFKDVTVLAIDVSPPRRALPDEALFKKWSDVYQWLAAMSPASVWARQAAAYFEIAESKLAEEGYLKEGTLTVFSGVPFDEDEPYNYPEAKRLLKLAMDELRQRKDLQQQLGMNPKGVGRGAITGRGGIAVWDFLRIKGSDDGEPFTKYPHLTLGLQHDRLLVMITIPHGITSAFRKNLVDLGFDGFSDLMATVNNNLMKVLRKAKGAAPWVDMVQRRYPSQRSEAIVDARIEYDLRTAFPSRSLKQLVKTQPEWLKATYDALSKKRSNLQVAVGAIFPYGACNVTKSPEVLDHVANTWIACKPLLDVMLKGRTH